MSGRILVVDDLERNRRLLKDRLEAEYYTVLEAGGGLEAIDLARAHPPDLILLDVMMPTIDGFETCRRLKADPATAHIPVVMVTALDGQHDRVNGLEAGADDFLTKPIDEGPLLARVRSLLRLKAVIDELRSRDATARARGVAPLAAGPKSDDWRGARLLFVHEAGRLAERTQQRLALDHMVTLKTDPREAIEAAGDGTWDVVLIDLASETFDGLRIAARLRSQETTRLVPILALLDRSDRDRMLRALEIGVNDLLLTPFDAAELGARVRTQILRKRYTDALRANLDASIELSVTDQLTGLHNRRFMSAQLDALLAEAASRGGQLAVMLTDIDFFKRINDRYGHDSGDAVLRGFASRLAARVRAVDLACRYGGEEFVVMMPGANLDAAHQVAERVRVAIESTPFRLPGYPEDLAVTVSIGLSAAMPGDTPDKLLKRADQALYAAKERGRNRIVIARPKARGA